MGIDPEKLFCQIIAGEVPADIVYEDDDVVAFRDVNPQAPTHVLVVPRQHIRKVSDVSPDQAHLLGRMTLAANQVARQEGLDDYRLVINCGESAGQSIWHIHMHVLGGRDLTWPPG